MISNISQATLDVIDAIKQDKSVRFTYGSSDELRTVNPTGFYGDFNGFEGTYSNTEEKEFRRFSFHRIEEWYGIPSNYRVIIELEVDDYPNDDDVRKHMYKILRQDQDILYSVQQMVN